MSNNKASQAQEMRKAKSPLWFAIRILDLVSTEDDDMMIINLYSANSMLHVQMRFTISIHEIEPKALKAPLAAAIRFMYDL